jgi:hypothetical protein
MLKKDYRIIVKGPYSKENVTTNFFLENINDFTKKEITEIDSQWNKIQEIAKKEKKILHDGKLLNLISFSAKKELKLNTKSTSYKHYAVGIKIDNKEIGEKLERNFPFSISGLIKTSDNFFVLAERSSLTFMDQGKIHLIPAGHPEYNSKNFKFLKIDLFDEILKETKEEIGLSNMDIDEIFLLGIIENFIPPKPEIVFLISTKLKKSEIKNNFNQSSDKWEHKKLLFVEITNKKIIDFISLDKNKKLPVLRGSLELFLNMKLK